MAEKEKIPETKEHRDRQPRSNQNLKIMYLMRILMQETDEQGTAFINNLVNFVFISAWCEYGADYQTDL